MIGDPDPGPSPLHCQRGFPVAASNDVSAPFSGPPTWTITLAPRSSKGSTSGDVAVPYCGSTAGAGTRHSSLPLARSNADRIPPIPNVKTRPAAMAGVDFGPAPCDHAAELMVYGAGYAARQISLPDATSRARTISSSPSRAITTTRLPDTTGEACPAPTGVSHRFFSASGHRAGSEALTEPSRLGPRHCGQSVPDAAGFCWACETGSAAPATIAVRIASIASVRRGIISGPVMPESSVGPAGE